MAVLAWGIVILAGICLGAALIAIATPTHIRLAADAGDKTRLTVEIRPLWGIGPRLRLIDSDRPGAGRRKRRTGPSRRNRAPRRRAPDGEDLRWLARAAPGPIRAGLRRIRFDGLDVDIRFGTGDPAETGQLFGQMTPVIYGFAHERFSISVEPDFERRCLAGRIEAGLRLVPATLLWPVARLALAFRARAR